MVDSRDKGGRAERQARDKLRNFTKLDWQRVPGSGALAAEHKLKGDLYVPDCKNVYCVEVKHYKDDHLTSKLLTSKTPQIMEWWDQAVRQANQVGQKPLLLFKFNRSSWFVCTDEEPKELVEYLFHSEGMYFLTLKEYMKDKKAEDFYG